MNEQPIVSICSITYNHAPYIRQCLDGMLMQQTNFAFEILINDDCSTDGTTEIIREYAEKYPDIIKPIFHRENQYQKGVRGMFAKYVFPKAQGKYIALCEGDDYWTDPLKLQKQVDFLETYPDYSLYFHNAMVHFEDGKTSDHPFGEIEDRDYTDVEIYEKWTIPTASVVLRKDVIESDLYTKVSHEKRFVYGDIVLSLTASKCGKIHGSPEIMSIYRKHSGGVVFQETLSHKSFKHDIALGELFGKEIQKATKIILSKKYFVYFSQQFKKSNYTTAIWAAYKSISISPKVFCQLINRLYIYRLWKH